jgi:multidrug efflux pump subunit AcrB
VLGNAQTAHQLGNSQISLGNGRTVKLSDIAEVRDLYAEQRSYALLDGKQVLSFSITRAKGASDVSVYEEVNRALAEIEKDNPKVHFRELFTSVNYTEDAYHSSMMAMIEGAVLAVVVVFLFLRDWRATIISALAIPLSAIPAFWFMDMMGFTLNMMTLLALSLVAGVLVDDAIVEIENIVRHMRMGKSAYQASIDAADEIGLAVLATTMSIVAVFLPVGLMPGFAGQFFKNFGITVVISVLMSLAVARMITPMLAAYFLKAHGHAEHGNSSWERLYMKLLRWTLDTEKMRASRSTLPNTRTRLSFMMPTIAIGVLAAAGVILSMKASVMSFVLAPLVFLIAAVIGFLIVLLISGLLARFMDRDKQSSYFNWTRYRLTRFKDHRVWVMLSGGVALMLTGLSFSALPFEFIPTMDQDFSQIRIEMTPGTTLDQTAAVTRRVQSMIAADKDMVSTAFAEVDPASARIFMTLSRDRPRSSVDFEKSWAPRLAAIPDARVTFASQTGNVGGRDISITLGGDDPVKLNDTANALVAEMARLPQLVAPRVAGDLARPEIIVRPRMDLAASMGVTTAALSSAIRLATLGDIDQNSAKFSLSDRQIPIRVALNENSRRDLSTIENMPVQTSTGGSVPLKAVAEIQFGSGPTTIQRTNQNRRITVGADLAVNPATGKPYVSSEAMVLVNALPTLKNLPMGVSQLTLGQSKFQAEMVNNFIIAVVSGFFLVFAVLVLLYHRILPPLVNMGSLLLAPLGAALALHLVGMSVSMPVMIGVLMLLGIVAKNSILLIDFALEEMNAGVDRYDAIVDAGHKRAQPIVMTTIAMCAGMVPTALSLSGDGAFRQPMGVTVIGGLMVSTILTLLIIPALFSLAIGVESRIGPWLRSKLLTYRPGDENSGTTAPYPAE